MFKMSTIDKINIKKRNSIGAEEFEMSVLVKSMSYLSCILSSWMLLSSIGSKYSRVDESISLAVACF